MPNFIAYIALLSWPIVTIFLIKRKGLEVGVLLALLGAHMFLPVAFKIDLPAIPPLNKYSITTVTILIYLILNKKRLGFIALHRYMKFVFVMLLVLPFLTALTNSERYSYLPGLTLYDGLSDAITNFLIIVPFLFGVRYFNTYEKQLILFKYFAIAAFVYAFFTLYEVRMSPRLHWMLYGYFPNSWLQQYREGGFRAIVFMGHGLLVAIFLALGVAAATAMTRLKEKVLPIKTLYVLIIIFMTLVLQKSLASLIFGTFGLIMIILMSPKRMHQMALLIGLLFLTYPMLSSLNLFPHKTILDVASRVSAERAQSLEFRFEQEKALLNHANSKPLFGWGGWGRNRIVDDLTGSDTSTTDGRWIITLGVSGWVGYLSQFLLIVVPLYLTYRITVKRRIHDKKESILLGAHAILLSVLLLDQMPNSSLNSFYWLVVGSLLGRAYKINQDYLGEKRAESSHNTKLVNSVDNG